MQFQYFPLSTCVVWESKNTNITVIKCEITRDKIKNFKKTSNYEHDNSLTNIKYSIYHTYKNWARNLDHRSGSPNLFKSGSEPIRSQRLPSCLYPNHVPIFSHSEKVYPGSFVLGYT